MPNVHRKDEKYSSGTGVVFLFNLIVGTGALALPGALAKGGWAIGVLLLLTLALFSFITVTFVLETLAVSNAVSRKRYELDREGDIEHTPLVPRNEGQENNVFEITEKYEIGQMGVLMSPKWSQIIIYLCLCVYLFGDLSIYAAVIGRTCEHVICTQANVTNSTSEDTPCWEAHGLTRLSVYRLSVIAFMIIMGPFVFFNLQKTKFLQILTGILRWLAFIIMLGWAIQKLITSGVQGHPKITNLKALPTLFGTIVYSFMCQHSIPGLLQPISNKSHLKYIIAIDFTLAPIFYLSLSLTAIFAFATIQELYTLNFWIEANKPGTSTFSKVLAYYLALFPVFTLSTSFPIIGITLRNNLRSMILKNAPPKWYYDNLLFPFVTILPPAALALAVSDLHLLVGVIGSYAGACVQYLIPCLLVSFARIQAKEFNTENIHASPFKCKFWIVAVYLWMCVSLVFISLNYGLNL